MRCAPVASDAHSLVETTGCRFTPASQCEQELGARSGILLPESSLDSAGGLGWGPAHCSFRHAIKETSGWGDGLPLLHGQIRPLGSQLDLAMLCMFVCLQVVPMKILYLD